MTAIVIYVFISVLLGGISCLFGRKLYFPVLMLTVFCAVLTISFSLFELNLAVGAVTALIGLLSALLVRLFYKLGVFLMGGVLGGAAGLLTTSLLSASAAKHGWILILLFLVAAGVCAVKWCDFFIMASTSFNGAFAITAPLCFLFTEFHNLRNFIYTDGMLPTITNLNQYLNSQFSLEHGTMIFVLTLLLTAAGFCFQANSMRLKNASEGRD